MSITATTKRKKVKNADKMAKLIGEFDSVSDSKARDRLVGARVALLLKHSFFGNLATRLQLVNADDWLPTAATDGRKFYYNSKFINMLRQKEVEFLVAHEVLHVIYDHMDRRDARDHQVWNIAADYCVNADLRKHNVGEFITTVPCLYESKYAGKPAEEVYDDLMKNNKNIDLDDLIDQLLDDHMNESNEGDGNGNRPQKMSDAEREQLRQEIKENIINAAKSAKDAGHGVPDSVARMIKEMTEPEMNWRELIQSVLTSSIKTDYSFMRPSRRGWHVDAILPSQTPGEEIDITVAIDTSGSIGNKELVIFLSEIQGIMNSFAGYKINVISWDTGVHNPQDFTSENLEDIAEYVPGGGGGTDVNCVFDYLKEQGRVPQRLVIFTDGFFFGSDGDPDYCDVVWVVKGNPSFKATHGTWAHFSE